jgi:phage gp29-like protein
MLDRADQACDLLVLGQTLTSTQGDKGSQALGTVHQSVRSDIIDSAALWLAEILNEQIIPSIAAVNFGETSEDSALPWFQPARKDKKDTKVIAETFEIILRSGIPLLKEEVYDALDMSQPKDGEDAFGQTQDFKTQDARTDAAGLPPNVRAMLAKMPLDAREYFLSRLS